MGEIKRSYINEGFAFSGVVEAGDFVFLSFCVGNVGQGFAAQVHGALDDMEQRLASVGLTLAEVVQVTPIMRDPWDIPEMEAVFKQRFGGVYPARKTIATEFAHEGGAKGLQFQMDAIAYRGK